MLKLESLTAFVAIAETGSVVAAARRLGISKSVVSERLADLERGLGARFVQRTTRRLSLTQDGTAFYARARQILRDVDLAATEVAQRRGTLAGPLRISGPVSFGSLHLGPALFGLLRTHPDIELSLELDDRFVDVLAEGYDAVVRHGPVEDKRLIVKKLAASRRVLVASPDYLTRFGTPSSLPELQRQHAVIYTNRGPSDWRFRVGRKFVTVSPITALRVNNGLLMRDAALAGLAMALLPTFLLETPFKNRTLRIVDVGAEPEGATIFVGYPQDLRASEKIRTLTGWLRQTFGTPPYWESAVASEE
jgi:DNA-binding transcriptional LysR family regulator